MQYLHFKHHPTKTLQGFTLVEALVAIFIFTIIMAATSQIFATAFVGYRNTRSIARDIDNAQYSLNIIAKELRTSSVVDPASGSLVSRTDIKFYDHSQDKCFRYRINANHLEVASGAAADSAACLGMTLNTFTTISTGVITGSFQVTPSTSSPPRVGRVTLYLDISEGSSHHARIQTSVSLRDFATVGL
jgi:prepilin-type N-terminal cleavage/methylation domain-containing protein